MRPWAAALALALASCARAAVDIEELSNRVDSLADQLSALHQMGKSNYDAIQKLAQEVKLEVHENDEFFKRLNVRIRVPAAHSGLSGRHRDIRRVNACAGSGGRG